MGRGAGTRWFVPSFLYYPSIVPSSSFINISSFLLDDEWIACWRERERQHAPVRVGVCQTYSESVISKVATGVMSFLSGAAPEELAAKFKLFVTKPPAPRSSDGSVRCWTSLSTMKQTIVVVKERIQESNEHCGLIRSCVLLFYLPESW